MIAWCPFLVNSKRLYQREECFYLNGFHTKIIKFCDMNPLFLRKIFFKPLNNLRLICFCIFIKNFVSGIAYA
jgi:hypothetical protein